MFGWYMWLVHRDEVSKNIFLIKYLFHIYTYIYALINRVADKYIVVHHLYKGDSFSIPSSCFQQFCLMLQWNP